VEKIVLLKTDESKFGKRKYNKGHKVGGVWVVGAVERESRKIVFQHVEKRDAQTLNLFCKKYINKLSPILSDC
jgi:hypothetical protein